MLSKNIDRLTDCFLFFFFLNDYCFCYYVVGLVFCLSSGKMSTLKGKNLHSIGVNSFLSE